jgi:ubiquinone/menaquinone biosynthesis C-methylase UbiE
VNIVTSRVSEQVRIQRQYYADTAGSYDSMHSAEEPSIAMACHVLCGLTQHIGASSILDIGAGTGSVTMRLRDRLPGIRVVGVEPVEALREVGIARGLGRDQLVDGDATSLTYADGAFDIVCEFAALHHIPDPEQAVSEMLRVARQAVFICDVNNFGQGGALSRWVKQTVNLLGLWPLFDWAKTRGRGYSVSEGDGLYYSYSVFNQLPLLRRHCSHLYFMNTDDSSPDLYRTAAGAIIFGIKKS